MNFCTECGARKSHGKYCGECGFRHYTAEDKNQNESTNDLKLTLTSADDTTIRKSSTRSRIWSASIAGFIVLLIAGLSIQANLGGDSDEAFSEIGETEVPAPPQEDSRAVDGCNYLVAPFQANTFASTTDEQLTAWKALLLSVIRAQDIAGVGIYSKIWGLGELEEKIKIAMVTVGEASESVAAIALSEYVSAISKVQDSCLEVGVTLETPFD